jgi:hypothetical protein
MMSAVLARLRDPATVICGPKIAGCHTALIEQVAAAAEIRTVPAAMIEWHSGDGPAGSMPVVAGLEPALRRAFATGDMLADSGFALSDSEEAAVER